MDKHLYMISLLKEININKNKFLNEILPVSDKLISFFTIYIPKKICNNCEKIDIKNIYKNNQKDSQYDLFIIEFDGDFSKEYPLLAISISKGKNIRLFVCKSINEQNSNKTLYQIGEIVDKEYVIHCELNNKQTSLFKNKVIDILIENRIINELDFSFCCTEGDWKRLTEHERDENKDELSIIEHLIDLKTNKEILVEYLGRLMNNDKLKNFFVYQNKYYQEKEKEVQQYRFTLPNGYECCEITYKNRENELKTMYFLQLNKVGLLGSLSIIGNDYEQDNNILYDIVSSWRFE